MVGAAGAIHGLGRDVVARHQGGIEGTEIDLPDALVQSDDRLVHEATLVRDEKIPGRLPPLGLPFLPGDQDPVGEGLVELHLTDR